MTPPIQPRPDDDLYRAVVDIRAEIELLRENVALALALTERAGGRLEALLLLPSERPHDERAESVTHLERELHEILALVGGVR